MAKPLSLQVVCEDFLKDNRRLYAHKAKRKKISLIAVEAVCTGDSETVTIDLGAAELVTDKKRHGAELPDRLISKVFGIHLGVPVFPDRGLSSRFMPYRSPLPPGRAAL